MFIAILADHLFGNVGSADLDVLTPARRGDVKDIAVLLYLKAQRFKDPYYLICGNVNTQNSVHIAYLHIKPSALAGSSGADISARGAYRSAFKLGDKVKSARHSKLGGVLGDPLFVEARCVCVLT